MLSYTQPAATAAFSFSSFGRESLTRKLTYAPAPPGYEAVETKKLEGVQEAFQEKHYVRKPVDTEFLAYLVADLKPFLHSVKLIEDFTTPDGRVWRAISFLCITGNKYLILFPHHENGETTGHVSMFCLSDGEKPDQKEVDDVAQMVEVFFRHALHDFYWKKR